MANYVANCPISRPMGNFSNHKDMNGFGWNAAVGIFLPHDIEESSEHFEEPSNLFDGWGDLDE